jgi:hypothetical protein
MYQVMHVLWPIIQILYSREVVTASPEHSASGLGLWFGLGFTLVFTGHGIITQIKECILYYTQTLFCLQVAIWSHEKERLTQQAFQVEYILTLCS